MALFLFGVRWAAWAVAAFIVTLGILPEANVHREPALLFITMGQNAAATLYLPLMRPRVRSLFQRSIGEVNDILVLSFIDVTIALAIVYLSGGWDSPYYLYAVTSLLVPSSLLGLRANLVLAVGFVGVYIIALSTAGSGTDGPWLRGEMNNFAVFLATPFLVAVVVQFFGWMARQLTAERERAQQVLDENIRLQGERERLIAQEERNRIAREIHDGIAQSIYMLSLNLETAAEMAAGEGGLSERLAKLVTLAKQALLEVRHYIFDLKPLLTGEATLSSALQSQIREFTTVSGLPARLEVAGQERPLPVVTGTAVYRIAQEALANVYRHAQASDIDVLLSFDHSSVHLEVRDNGVGFAGEGDRGRGLKNMRQRAQELGGDVTIESSPASGTKVHAVLPLREE
ncbi:MAG: sensor histidine kinase [Chloroflexi bacterium]|nr:sensor histidine kinase [Chloroflexota bacterium]